MHAEALVFKSKALRDRATRVVPSGLRYWLWPRFGDVVRKDLAGRYAAWSGKCLEQSATIRSELGEMESETERAELARRLLSDPIWERAFSKGIWKAQQKLRRLSESIQAEARKLGYVSD